MKLVRSLTAAAALVLASGSMFLAACASNPSYIEPTVQPGGIRTPGVHFYPPSSGGVDSLPDGFKPCGSFTTKVTLEDGSTVTLSGCVYCSGNPNDSTVYVQHNCEGPYRKGIRDNMPQRQIVPPATKRLGSVGGTLGETQSELKFTVEEDFTMVPAMLQAEKYGVKMLINGLTPEEWNQFSLDTFPAGTTVTVAGDNEGIAGAMFWSFGSARIGGTTDGGQAIEISIGRSDEFGLVMVGTLDGELQPEFGHIWFPEE